MMSEGLFTAMLVLFWVAELTFGSLVAYWFITQGFDDDRATAGETVFPLEDRSVTMRSLGLWAGFFGAVLLGILVGA
jgi:hypothetical protein